MKLERKFIRSQLKNKNANSTKLDHGHALLIAGNTGYMGAAVIATKAALRSGVGLLTVSVPLDERWTLQVAVPQAMLITQSDYQIDLEKFSTIGIGPGLGENVKSHELLQQILRRYKSPMVLDADALNIISSNQHLVSSIPAESIITPHVAEFDRLFGIHESHDDRVATAIIKANEHHLVIVLKGHQTTIVSEDEVRFNHTGNAGLAKGGSGDALTGIITSLLAQGYLPWIAACIGVYLHGLASDLTLKRQSIESMLITDVIDHLGKAFKRTRR
ncbi:NAD(P)H-hydrate dehydratase [Sphingobacterium bovisgrunnientis]|uniref:NAD(P)H-hydrate dehydratase n=1 Tax=Sphingobacterium bovisgrunnientis TaxID=1874697 RepID=UPI001357F008|nr:NAD(P)H-hydrate dehydratase [Sphingobacterium bovisgrunnientis]